MNNLLRTIPKVDDILKDPRWAELAAYPAEVAKSHLRDVLAGLRASIREGKASEGPSLAAIIAETKARTEQSLQPTLKKVINGTGVIIHTNLGRAPLAASAIERLLAVAAGYSNLEYRLAEGKRGDRHEHCLALLKRLTGAEGALVVNNNAAAVLLALNTLAEGREVVISRGELIEIGGSFRIPEIMAKSGAILKEVGTTNRTFKEDYERNVSERTGLIMKAHTSNYRIRGFVHETTSGELAGLAAAANVPFYFDAGSGLLAGSGSYAADEPLVLEETRIADVVSFSGDKLLGGPQAGILLGRASLISAMKKNPLTRALRPDKFTLAALEATLQLYLDREKARREIPVLHMLYQSPTELKRRASKVAAAMRRSAPAAGIEVVKLDSEMGGGSLPEVAIPSYGLSVSSSNLPAEKIEQRMRSLDIPVVGRIEKGRFLIDMRTVRQGDEACLIAAIQTALGDGR